MARLAHELDTTLDATVDFVLAAGSLLLIAFPAVTIAASIVGDPLAAYESLVLFSVSVGGSYPFVAGDWSIRRLTDYVVAFLGCAVAVGVLAFLVLVASGHSFAPGDPFPQFVVFGLAYPLGYGFTAVDGFGILAGTKDA